MSKRSRWWKARAKFADFLLPLIAPGVILVAKDNPFDKVAAEEKKSVAILAAKSLMLSLAAQPTFNHSLTVTFEGMTIDRQMVGDYRLTLERLPDDWRAEKT